MRRGLGGDARRRRRGSCGSAAGGRGRSPARPISAIVIGAGRDVHETGLERPVVLDLQAAGQAMGDVVGRAEHVLCPREHVRLVRSQPHQLRSDQLLAVAGAGQTTGKRTRPSRAILLQLGVARASFCWMRAAQRPSGSIEQDDRRQHAGDADGRDRHLRPWRQGRGRSRRRCATTPRCPPPPSWRGRSGR